MTEAEDVLGAALGQDVRVRRDGNGVRAELRFDDLAELESLAKRLRRRPELARAYQMRSGAPTTATDP